MGGISSPELLWRDMCVVGAFVLSAAILRDARWVAIVSPLFITALLILGSGMPTTERCSYSKYGR